MTNSITRRGETARPARDNLFWGGEDGSPSIAIGTRERKKVVTGKRERRRRRRERKKGKKVAEFRGVNDELLFIK